MRKVRISVPRVLLLVAAFGFGAYAVAPVIVGEGADRRTTQGEPRPSAVPVAPSPTPTYAQWPELSPADQVTVRVRWEQAPPEYQETLCGFFSTVPRDAVSQGVREGLPRSEAKALVRFVVEELC